MDKLKINKEISMKESTKKIVLKAIAEKVLGGCSEKVSDHLFSRNDLVSEFHFFIEEMEVAEKALDNFDRIKQEVDALSDMNDESIGKVYRKILS